jgi:SAM-dependent methyltransferase
MPVFDAYSHYYDLLYRDKDYAAEAQFVHDLVARHLPGARSVLDLGCGTGRHDLLLAELGYQVTGVDLSEKMVQLAQKAALRDAPAARRPGFLAGDARSVRLDRSFDVVLSLFHVMCYQAGNQDLAAAFATVRAHLKPGGIFIFDCWYGPAVLTERPAVRIKRLEEDGCSVIRVAEPVMHPNLNLVDVNYQVLVKDTATGEVQELRESHRMRYLFRPELELLLAQAGLAIEDAFEWMTGREPGFDTWGVCFVVKASDAGADLAS